MNMQLICQKMIFGIVTFILGTLHKTDTDHCRLGKPHESCSFGDALTQLSSHHNLALVKIMQSHIYVSNISTLRTTYSLAA